MKILAIGGGDLGSLETLKFDAEMVRMTGKAHPNALLIPTASSDLPVYGDVFVSVYKEVLGCQTDVLFLLGSDSPEAEIARTIGWADLIYVGGGNTKMMVALWRERGRTRDRARRG